MKAKKVLVWLCAAAMLVSAAGCGSSAASTGSDAAGGQGVQEAEVESLVKEQIRSSARDPAYHRRLPLHTL